MRGFPTWIPRSPDWMVLLASTGYLHNPHHTTIPATPEAAMIIFIPFSALTRDVGISIWLSLLVIVSQDFPREKHTTGVW